MPQPIFNPANHEEGGERIKGGPIFLLMIRNAGYPDNNRFSFGSLNHPFENVPFKFIIL